MFESEQQWVMLELKNGRKIVWANEYTSASREKAEAQGFSGPDAPWEQLWQLALLYVMVGEWVWNGPSCVAIHESGERKCPAYDLLYEESIALAFQRFLNTGDVPKVLQPWHGHLTLWQYQFLEAIEQLLEE